MKHSEAEAFNSIITSPMCIMAAGSVVQVVRLSLDVVGTTELPYGTETSGRASGTISGSAWAISSSFSLRFQ